MKWVIRFVCLLVLLWAFLVMLGAVSDAKGSGWVRHEAPYSDDNYFRRCESTGDGHVYVFLYITPPGDDNDHSTSSMAVTAVVPGPCQ